MNTRTHVCFLSYMQSNFDAFAVFKINLVKNKKKSVKIRVIAKGLRSRSGPTFRASGSNLFANVAACNSMNEMYISLYRCSSSVYMYRGFIPAIR